MLAIDTNILFHAFNADSPKNDKAYQWLSSIADREDIVISEFVLAELYRLVRNPVVSKNGALSAAAAVQLIDSYRNHPRWMVVGFSINSKRVHDQLWKIASKKNFAYRRLFDVRTALTLIDYGVDEIATVNLKDFQGIGFKRVSNPLS